MKAGTHSAASSGAGVRYGLVWVVLAVLTTGCASQAPATKSATVPTAAPASAKPGAASVQSTTPEAESAQTARPAAAPAQPAAAPMQPTSTVGGQGRKPRKAVGTFRHEVRNGKNFYCDDGAVLGSRLNKPRCYTEEEYEQWLAVNRDTIQEMERGPRGPMIIEGSGPPR
jgi:hypothetical protein